MDKLSPCCKAQINTKHTKKGHLIEAWCRKCGSTTITDRHKDYVQILKENPMTKEGKIKKWISKHILRNKGCEFWYCHRVAGGTIHIKDSWNRNVTMNYCYKHYLIAHQVMEQNYGKSSKKNT